MVKKRAYTSPKHRPDKPECAGSSPARGTNFNIGKFMKHKISSRGPEVDTDKCVENIGNRFDLVLIAAIRSRELARQHKNSGRSDQINAPVTALLEIQNGKIGVDYKKRVK